MKLLEVKLGCVWWGHAAALCEAHLLCSGKLPYVECQHGCGSPACKLPVSFARTLIISLVPGTLLHDALMLYT